MRINSASCLVSFVLAGCASGSPREVPLSTDTTAVSPTASDPAREKTSSAPMAPAPTASAVVVAPPAPDCPDGMVKVEGATVEVSAVKKKTVVEPLCVDKLETTASEYEACVDGGGCNANFVQQCKTQSTFKSADKATLPMTCIDYMQAEAYCTWAKKRLPTDGEWELAARGTEGRKYAWGDDPPQDQACWSGGPGGVKKGTCAVGSLAGGNTPSGIADMTGNVFEWTQSPGDAKRTTMIAKGGSWLDGTAPQMSASRPGGFKPSYRCGFGGVRCVTAAAKR